MTTEQFIWKPLEFDEKWLDVSTSKFDGIAPSWHVRRDELKENEAEYQRFLNRLKRQQAIETGVIERLYDLNEGITETFIKEGFKETFIQHGDTNIDSYTLMKYLTDHYAALDLIFDYVRDDRRISKSFLRELHQLITQHQEYVDVIDQLGVPRKVKLLKGEFKKMPNNPKKIESDTRFMYCPPEQVEPELEKLIVIHGELENRGVHALIKAAFFHHAFTQIHPFQDGNGRMARLLASLILIKENLFPLTLQRDEKVQYIESLEDADNGEYSKLVQLFGNIQIRNIEAALNWKVVASDTGMSQVINLFKNKVVETTQAQALSRLESVRTKRNSIFEIIRGHVEKIVQNLEREIDGYGSIYVDVAPPESEKHYYFSHEISQYASQHKYFFNPKLPRGWIKVKICIGKDNTYQVILSQHHYGYGDSTIALGAFLESVVDDSEISAKIKDSGIDVTKRGLHHYANLPLEISPLTISVDISPDDLEISIEEFLNSVFAVSLANITSEL